MTVNALIESLDILRAVTDKVPADSLHVATPCDGWSVTQVLVHAAADQHVWAAVVGDAAMPETNPFDPTPEPSVAVADLVSAAVEVAIPVWTSVDAAAVSVPTPLPPVPELAPDLAAAAAALDAAVHAWDVAVATGQPSPLTDSLARQLRGAATATAEPLRGFAYAAPLASVPGEGDAAALLRFLGRDPSWVAR